MDEIVLALHAALTHLEELTATADLLLDASLAANTRRAYQSYWRQFSAWCDTHGLRSFPALPSTIVLYITDLATVQQRKVTTIERRLVAIRKAHRTARLNVANRGYRSRADHARHSAKLWHAAQRKSRCRDRHRVRDGCNAAGDKQGYARPGAAVVGFAGAFRRSELVSLEVSNVQFVADVLVITLSCSKTDQEGEGTIKGVSFGSAPAACPVQALRAWLDRSKIGEGPSQAAQAVVVVQ